MEIIEKYEIPPHEIKGILIKRDYTYNVVSPSKNHTDKVKIVHEDTITGEKAYTFENTNDSLIIIEIFKK